MECNACQGFIYDEFTIIPAECMVSGFVTLCLDCDLIAEGLDANAEDFLDELQYYASH